MKTAALFSAACELGGFISESSPEVIGALKVFGGKVGTAYQVYDDLLDLAGSEENSGKTLGTDLRKGKFTLPILLLLQRGSWAELSKMLLEDEEYEKVGKLVRDQGALPAAAESVQKLTREAIEALEIIPPNRYSQGLRSVAKHVSALTHHLVINS